MHVRGARPGHADDVVAMGWARVSVLDAPRKGGRVTDAPLVTSLGHAGLRVETADLRLLADPWVSGAGPSSARGSRFRTTASCRRASTLDVRRGRGVPRAPGPPRPAAAGRAAATVPVVVPRYPSTIMERRLRAAGRGTWSVLDAWQRYPLGDRGDWLTVIPEQCPMSHDSGVLSSVGGDAVLHTNDARISLAQVRRAVAEVGRPIDLMGVQMSGASWHPVCYEYDEPTRDPDQRGQAGRQVQGRHPAGPQRSSPGWCMPYAGPPCFLDPELVRAQQRPARRRASSPTRARRPRGCATGCRSSAATTCCPATRVDVGSATRSRASRTGTASRSPRPRRAAATWRTTPPAGPATIAADLGREPGPGRHRRPRRPGSRSTSSRSATLSEYFLARIGMTLRFEVDGPDGGGGTCTSARTGCGVDLDGGPGSPATGCGSTPAGSGRCCPAAPAGRSCCCRCGSPPRREPDHYNDYLVGLLKHADAAALARRRASSRLPRDPDETIEVARRRTAASRSAGTARTRARTCAEARRGHRRRAALPGRTTSSSTWPAARA